jgi:Fe-S oxidoreductase
VHGHCHQKALGALSPTLEAMRSVGYRPELIQTGCCGMAGSFGYEAEHFDLSRLMAQDRLLPALEALPKEAWLVADGCSCRHQILDFAGRESLHAAEVIEKALAVGYFSLLPL